MTESHGALTFLALLAAMIVAALALYALQRRRTGLRPIVRQTLPELMGEGMLVLDVQGRVVDLNQMAACLLGAPRKGVIGHDAASVLQAAPRLMELARDPAAAAAAAQAEIALGTGASATYCDVSVSPLTNASGRQIGKLVVLYNITERRRYQQQIVEQRRDLAMLAERERLSRELHRGLDAALGAIITHAQQARACLTTDPQAAGDALAHAASIAQVANADVREYLLCVGASTALEQGFLSTLRQYLDRFGKILGMRVEWDAPAGESDHPFELWVQVQVLRIVQEALRNVRQRAGATLVRLSYRTQHGYARIIVEDDGVGFATDPLSSAEDGFGLHPMRERAEEVGGSLEVCSAPGQGTRVIVHVPLSGVRSQNEDD